MRQTGVILADRQIAVVGELARRNVDVDFSNFGHRPPNDRPCALIERDSKDIEL